MEGGMIMAVLVALCWIVTLVTLWGCFYIGHALNVTEKWYEIPFLATCAVGWLQLFGLSIYSTLEFIEKNKRRI